MDCEPTFQHKHCLLQCSLPPIKVCRNPFESPCISNHLYFAYTTTQLANQSGPFSTWQASSKLLIWWFNESVPIFKNVKYASESINAFYWVFHKFPNSLKILKICRSLHIGMRFMKRLQKAMRNRVVFGRRKNSLTFIYKAFP